MLLEAAAASDEQRCAELSTGHQSHQLAQQQQQHAGLHNASSSAEQQATEVPAHVGQQEHAMGRGTSSADATAAAAAAGAAAAAEPLLLIAQQLQHEVDGFAGHNQQLLNAAKKLCSSFRSGGRAVRVRALSLKLELQRHGIPAAGSALEVATGDRGSAAFGGVAGCAGGAAAAALPADVAAAVVKHWNEVETLLAQLHQSSEALLLPPPTPQQAQHGPQRHGADSSSSCSSARKRAVRKCKKLLDGLQQVLDLCQQQQQQQKQKQKHHPLGRGAAAAAVPEQAKHAATAADGSAKHSQQGKQVHVQQQQQQWPRAMPSRAVEKCGSSGSTASSEGLGALLAAVQKRLAPQDVASWQVPQGNTNTKAAGRQPDRTAVVKNAAAAAAAAAAAIGRTDQWEAPVLGGAAVPPSSGIGTAVPVRQAKQQQRQEHRQQYTAGDDQGWATGEEDSSVRSSAVIRRAERAALMERLRQMQQAGTQ
jgi:hypothetical protein